MYRYTTPTIPCTISGIELASVDFVRIAIEGKNALIVRVIPVAEITDPIRVTLTQEETASLGTGNDVVEIQARIKYRDGTVQATNKVRTMLEDVLDKVVV